MGYAAFDLSGKVALVTGGNGGIGLAMAEALGRAGAAVAIWGRREDRNEAALCRLRDGGVRAFAYRCDVSSRAEVDEAFGRTLADLGRVDGCFANAGVLGAARSFLDLDEAEWRRVLSVNLDGAFFALQAAARHMVARAEAGDPGGRLVATASLAAISGAARNEHYAASKGAIVSMVRALAVELGRHGVTANAILPGWVETEMTEGVFAWQTFQDRVLPRVPLRRWGRPEDFGGAAVYLMSDASSYHTGDSLVIDGGYWVF